MQAMPVSEPACFLQHISVGSSSPHLLLAEQIQPLVWNVVGLHCFLWNAARANGRGVELGGWDQQKRAWGAFLEPVEAQGKCSLAHHVPALQDSL